MKVWIQPENPLVLIFIYFTLCEMVCRYSHKQKPYSWRLKGDISNLDVWTSVRWWFA